jgi:hypothetical protein
MTILTKCKIAKIQMYLDKYLKYNEFENFKNIQEIGFGAFGKVYRVNWKHFGHYLVLNITVKEIFNEVTLLLK